MDDQPNIERRIRAAMELAGLSFIALAKRIATPNYGERTLRNMVNEAFTDRVASRADLALIGRACGVSDAFWTVDFRELEEPSLREEVTALSDQLADLAVVVGRQGEALRAFRDPGQSEESREGDGR
jgi:hypothetical protein